MGREADAASPPHREELDDDGNCNASPSAAYIRTRRVETPSSLLRSDVHPPQGERCMASGSHAGRQLTGTT